MRLNSIVYIGDISKFSIELDESDDNFNYEIEIVGNDGEVSYLNLNRKELSRIRDTLNSVLLYLPEPPIKSDNKEK